MLKLALGLLNEDICMYCNEFRLQIITQGLTKSNLIYLLILIKFLCHVPRCIMVTYKQQDCNNYMEMILLINLHMQCLLKLTWSKESRFLFDVSHF